MARSVFGADTNLGGVVAMELVCRGDSLDTKGATEVVVKDRRGHKYTPKWALTPELHARVETRVSYQSHGGASESDRHLSSFKNAGKVSGSFCVAVVSGWNGHI